MQPFQLPGSEQPSSGLQLVRTLHEWFQFYYTDSQQLVYFSEAGDKMFMILLRFQFFFSSPGRVDNVYGDRNLICTLLSPSQAEEEQKAAAATA